MAPFRLSLDSSDEDSSMSSSFGQVEQQQSIDKLVTGTHKSFSLKVQVPFTRSKRSYGPLFQPSLPSQNGLQPWEG